MQLQPEPEQEQEPEPSPEPQPATEYVDTRISAQEVEAEAVATMAAASSARIARLENQTILSYYAGKPEMPVIDMYNRGPPGAVGVSVRPLKPGPQLATLAATAQEALATSQQMTTPLSLKIRGGDLVRICYPDAAQYDGRVGVATGRRNEATGRCGVAVPMTNGAEGTLMVPPDCLQRHSGPSEPSAAQDAVEFLSAGAAALKMAEVAKNRTQRRAWLRRAVMW